MAWLTGAVLPQETRRARALHPVRRAAVRRAAGASLVAGLLLVAGCGVPAPSVDGAEAGSAGAATSGPMQDAPLWSAEGLEAQHRVGWLRQRTPPELDYQPGTTPWHVADFDLSAELTSPMNATAASPGALLAQFVDAIGWNTTLGTEAWEQTTRVLHAEDGEATGIVLRWGLMDDAIAGQDVRLRMREGAGGWYIERADERFHCSRGVSDSGLCV